MNEKYQIEIDNFIKRFKEYQTSRIVLYGIGRYTATLLEGLEGFNIVGLMDKEPANIGKKIFGVPVIDKYMAEEKADIIIINTAQTYWDIIYSRIQDIRIPIYYINGKKAVKKENIQIKNPFKELSYSSLSQMIKEAEVISFDFFDTLFMRNVCNPQDVFQLMEIEISIEASNSDTMECNIPFRQIRSDAKKYIRENYSLDELYLQIEIQSKIPHIQIEQMKLREIELEKKLLVPRSMLLKCLKEILEHGKEVYIISDMYLPQEFYKEALEEYGIFLSQEHILLSNELDANKQNGSLWKYYTENIVRKRNALHIGDNIKSDIEEPIKYGIKAYFIPSVWELFLNSSLKNIAPDICNIYDASVMGCILDRLFENPFVLSKSNKTISIKDNFEMGYCVFGLVILTFLLWLCKKSKSDKIKKLVFMSRDGYFLKEDLKYLCELTRVEVECCYIGISRQLAMMASIETEEDLKEYINMPYSGDTTEMLEDRFGIKDIKKAGDKNINEYFPQIEEQVKKVRKNYIKYIKGFGLDNECAVVDIGYYGNNQRYLNKLLKTNMKGYYFNANISEKNVNIKTQEMTACFQKESDHTGEESQILKKQIYLESFLTAPYGMIRGIEEDGSFICAPKGKNQKYFEDKEKINRGVKQFMSDYIKKFGGYKLEPDIEFTDKYYGNCFSGALEFADEVKRSFYNDNAMMNRIESNLFY